MMGQISAWRFGGMIHGTAEELGGKPVPFTGFTILQGKARFFVDH
jgi:hypothetical protein